MKNFTEYLTESVKQYPFRVKIAGTVTAEKEEAMKGLLGRYTVSEKLEKVKKSTTPVQALPLDFPQVRNCEVNIYEFTLDYPTTQQELTEYLSQGLEVSKQNLVVRRPDEPYEEYQHDEPKREGALLNDPDYKEAGNPKFENYYGDKYNSGFVKELNDLLKLERKARGEQIPTEGAAKFNTDTPANTTSDLAQAPDPRK
jgi:hypothetical protein